MKTEYIIKRILAFLLDLIILNMLIGMFIPFNSAEQLNEVNELLSSPNTSIDVLLDSYKEFFDMFAYESIFIVVLYIMYYVVVTKLLNGRTFGCMAFKLKIIKTNKTPLTYSDLTIKMLLANGGIIYLAISIIFLLFSFQTALAMILFTVFQIIYLIFAIVNFAFLLVKSTTLVDMLSKTRPLIVVDSKKMKL